MCRCEIAHYAHVVCKIKNKLWGIVMRVGVTKQYYNLKNCCCKPISPEAKRYWNDKKRGDVSYDAANLNIVCKYNKFMGQKLHKALMNEWLLVLFGWSIMTK